MTSLTPAVIEAFEQAARTGLPVESTCRIAGVDTQSVANWLQVASGAETWPNGVPVSDQYRTLCSEFSTRMQRARAELEAEILAGIAEAGRTVGKSGVPEWRARAWLAEHVPGLRERYAQQTKVEQSGTVQHLHLHQMVQNAISTGGIDALEQLEADLLDSRDSAPALPEPDDIRQKPSRHAAWQPAE